MLKRLPINTLNAEIGCILFILFFAGYACSSTSEIYNSERLTDNDFRNYKRYAFSPTSDTSYTKMFDRRVVEQMLGKEVKNQLTKKGMTLDTVHPECVFTYKLIVNRKYEVSQQQEVVYNPEVYVPAFDNQARIYTFSSNNRPAVYAGKMYVDTLREGSLVIDMIDLKQNKVVWRSSAEGKSKETYQQPYEERVREIVKEMFKKFPRK